VTTRRQHRPRRTIFVAAAVLLLAVAIAGCGHSHPKGPTVTKDEMRTNIIATTRSIVQLTGIRLTGEVTLAYDSCTDNNGGPFQAVVNSTFVGKPTLSESEAQVDEWVALLRKHGWSAAQRIPRGATRYVPGPGGFSTEITPHLNPELQPGANFIVRSQCVLHGDLEYETENVAHEVNQ
jgi:hypothetical protein